MTNIPRILIIGSINMDLVMTLSRAPEAGETVLGSEYSYIPGGKGANQAVAAARLQSQTTFCGRIGNDPNGETLLKNLQDNGIDTSYIIRDDGSQTGLAVIPVESNGQNRIIVMPGANLHVSKQDVDKAFEKDYDAVMLQLEIPLDIVCYALEKAKKRNIPVILDAGPAMKVELERFKGVTVISPNETEAYALTGIHVDSEQGAERAAILMHELTQAQYVVIKMGARGAMLYHNGKGEVLPAYSTEVVDTTAAGDSFTAAMTVKLVEYGDIKRAIKYANAVGALCVSRRGAQPSLPAADEVKVFLEGVEN